MHGRYTSELGARDRKCPRYALLWELMTGGASSGKTARRVEAFSGAWHVASEFLCASRRTEIGASIGVLAPVLTPIETENTLDSYLAARSGRGLSDLPPRVRFRSVILLLYLSPKSPG